MIKEKLYEKILRERGIKTGAVEESIEAADMAEYDLSAGQMGIWFLQQMKPDSPVYNNPSAMRLEGKVNLKALNQAVFYLTEEYETLRTGFRLEEGKPVQYIKESIDCKIREIDCIGYEESLVRQKMNELASETFHLEEDTLFRVYLLKVTEEIRYILINIHHIISDGWSKGILLKKLSDIYGALVEEKDWDVSRKRTHYRGYVKWQKDWIASDAGKQSLQYWKEALADRPDVLNLTPDKVREKIQSGKGGITEFCIKKETYCKLKDLCKNHSLSPFLFLLSVMNIYLYKYTAQKDILIGTPIAGRSRQEFEDVSGYFVNSLVLRNKLDENQSFLSFAEKVKRSSVKAYQHQDIPFNLLVEKLNPVRELSYSPLFQVMMQFDNAPIPEMSLGNLTLRPVSLDTGGSQVDLSVTFWEDERLLKGTFEWDSALFDEDRIVDMIANFKSLLSAVIEQPDKAICAYQMLPQEQYQKMVYGWNETAYELPEENVLERLAGNAIKRASEIAVLHGKQSISYQELEEKSNRLSYVLKEKGVCKGSYVALCLESSIDYIIAVYGILKAGGILIPMDTTYPEKRIRFMMESLSIPLLIIAKKDAIKFIRYKEQLYIIENLLIENAKEHVDIVQPQGLDTICVIFTSGSSGNPNGVELSYDSMKNLVESFGKSYDVTQEDHIMSISGIASASFIGEILPAISHGAMLVLADMETVLNVELLGNYMEEHKITILSTVPSMIGRLNQSKCLPKCTRVLLSGGESLLPSHVDQMENVEIANGYGLTESGICNTYKLTKAEELGAERIADVGKPVINNMIYVLDKDRKPVPPFVLGDIYIGGISLANGYLNQEELTRERFLENPFAEGRLLKTGDTGYFLPDGDLFFVGREDRQVQLRGFRIELGEIERILESHAGVKETAAILLAKEECLAVYYTTQIGTQITDSQVTYWLKEQLPVYMVPKYCIRLEQMPYNQNGKINYKKLPPVKEQEKKHEVLKEQPQTETEEMIARIWRKYLEIENIGMNENFFDIGGHSLMLSQVFYELKQEIKTKLMIVNLFQYPTIRQLATFIRQEQEEKDEKEITERGAKQRNSYGKRLFKRN